MNNNTKTKDMKTEINTIEDIFNTELFTEMFDFETEKKEIEASGWNYNELTTFGQELSKAKKK